MRRPEHVLRYPESQQQDALYRVEPVVISAADIDYNGHGNYRSILKKYERGLGLDSGMYMSDLEVLYKGEVREGEEIIVHTRLVTTGEQNYEQWMTRAGQPISAVVCTLEATSQDVEQATQDDLYAVFEEGRALELKSRGTSVKKVYEEFGLGMFIPRLTIKRHGVIAKAEGEISNLVKARSKIITFDQTLTTPTGGATLSCMIALVDQQARSMVEIPPELLARFHS